MARKVKKAGNVRLPMMFWRLLARHLDPNAIRVVLEDLRADGRTWSAVASYAVAERHAVEARCRKQHGAAWRPQLNAWGQLAYTLACRRVPLRPPVVADIRDVLIEVGSVNELIRMDSLYGRTATGLVLRALTDALYAGQERYNWNLWSELVQFTGHLYPGEIGRYTLDKLAAARRDHDFDG
jgi:hypothetical protein